MINPDYQAGLINHDMSRIGSQAHEIVTISELVRKVINFPPDQVKPMMTERNFYSRPEGESGY